jgi:uncharacterized protein (DUF3084 family)
MKNIKAIRFFILYLFSLFVGNLIVYEVDKIGVKYGQAPMPLVKYIFVNLAVIVLSVLTYMAIKKQEKK